MSEKSLSRIVHDLEIGEKDAVVDLLKALQRRGLLDIRESYAVRRREEARESWGEWCGGVGGGSICLVKEGIADVWQKDSERSTKAKVLWAIVEEGL